MNGVVLHVIRSL